MTTTQKRAEILNGPSADRIFDALKYAYTPDIRDDIRPTFEVVWQTDDEQENARPLHHRVVRVRPIICGVSYDERREGSLKLRFHIGKSAYNVIYDAAKRKGLLSESLFDN